MVSIAWLANHLWQSTLWAGVVWLLTLALRWNRASVRYWLWLAASAKFLIPFAGLVSLGGYLGWSTAREQPALMIVVETIEPFSTATRPLVAAMSSPSSLATGPFIVVALLGVWMCGCAAVIASWWIRWRRVRVVVRQGRQAEAGRELDALARLAGPSRSLRVMLTSGSPLVPGVLGFLRPMLLWPTGISARLDDRELEAILAHELAHVRRHDNLTSTVHMTVEAIFWFHPLVWWIGHHLLDERERACDEAVLRLGSDPHVYAESILKTCEFSLAGRVPCMAGVAGSNLKPRIERIMSEHVGRPLDFTRKLLLAIAGTAAVAGPLAAGAADAPRILGQPQPSLTRPAFEVASIKPNVSGAGGPGLVWFNPGGRFTATNATLEKLIETAFHVVPNKGYVVGGPKWLESDRFDIEAQAAAGTIPPRGEARTWVDATKLMLQVLLEERFKLSLRLETKELPIYELIAVRGGLKLGQPTDRDCLAPQSNCHRFQGGSGRGINGQAVSMLDLAEFLTLSTDRAVRDKTGITGEFDIRTTGWFDPRRRPADGAAQNGEENADPLGPSLFTVLEEQLGLKLIPRKGPVDVFVVEHAEQPTAD